MRITSNPWRVVANLTIPVHFATAAAATGLTGPSANVAAGNEKDMLFPVRVSASAGRSERLGPELKTLR